MPRTTGRKTQEFRARLKARWQPVNAACALCGQSTIDWDGPANAPDSFELDHKLPVRNYPHLEFVESNAQPSHHRCNRNKQAGPARAGIGITSEEW